MYVYYGKRIFFFSTNFFIFLLFIYFIFFFFIFIFIHSKLFFGLNWRQLIIDSDGKSSNVWFVIFLHTHACLEIGSNKMKKPKFIITHLKYAVVYGLTSGQSTGLAIGTATRCRKCTLPIDTRHYDRCQ